MTMHGTLLQLSATPLSTRHGCFTLHVFHNFATGRYALALVCGALDGTAPVLSRVHSSCITSEAYGGCDCDCVEQLDAALARIAAHGRGVVFYLPQEGRGAGLAAKTRDRMLVQASRNALTTFDAYARLGLAADQRRYDEVPAMCRLLGLDAPLLLLTGNPEKATMLAGDGWPVAGTQPLPLVASPFNLHYLEAKSRSGHGLTNGDRTLAAAEPPEPVTAFDPHPLPDAPRFVRLASYFLPVRLTPPVWFRLQLYFDTEEHHQRVILSYAASPQATPLVRVHAEQLAERFVPPTRWLEVARRIVAHGAGVVLFLDAERWGVSTEYSTDSAASLLAQHLPRGDAVLLFGRAAWDGGGTALTTALAQHGIRIAAPHALDAEWAS